ncbi:MAG: transposase, partial [Actinomycetota bacterium]|nr:transposase [Actinomycetota bacterium]
AKAALQALARDYRRASPSCTRALEDDLDALVVHLRFPSEHRKRIRSTDVLERSFVEIRRRTKLIGRFPGETSALCLIWAVLDLASRGWRGVTMTPRAVAEIERIRRALAAGEPLPEPAVDEEVIAAEDDDEAERRPSTFTRTMGRHREKRRTRSPTPTTSSSPAASEAVESTTRPPAARPEPPEGFEGGRDEREGERPERRLGGEQGQPECVRAGRGKGAGFRRKRPVAVDDPRSEGGAEEGDRDHECRGGAPAVGFTAAARREG